MTETDETVERIRAYATAMGWRKSRLAKEAGLRDTVLRHFDRAGWNPTRATVLKLLAIVPPGFESRAWRSLETAPRDGSTIEILTSFGLAKRAQWRASAGGWLVVLHEDALEPCSVLAAPGFVTLWRPLVEQTDGI